MVTPTSYKIVVLPLPEHAEAVLAGKQRGHGVNLLRCQGRVVDFSHEHETVLLWVAVAHLIIRIFSIDAPCIMREREREVAGEMSDCD
jgi:hypothetical protein